MPAKWAFLYNCISSSHCTWDGCAALQEIRTHKIHAQCNTNHIQNWAKADLKTVNRVMWYSLGYVVARTADWKVRATRKNNPSLNYEWMLLPLYCECDGSINWGCLTFISNSGPRYIFLYIINSDVTYAVGVVFVVFFSSDLIWDSAMRLEARMTINVLNHSKISQHYTAPVNVHQDN